MKNLFLLEKTARIRNLRRGFSLLELLIALGAISCVVAMGIVQFSGTTSPVKEAKLRQDVAALNRAVSTYRISGGDLNTISTGAAVLHKLKTTAAQRTRIAGLRGAMIDPRLRGITSSGNGPLRAVWDNTAKTFVVSKTGSGFREFVLEGAMDSLPAPVEEDRKVLMAMDSQDKWIWGFNDSARSSNTPRQAAAVVPVEVVTPSEGSNLTVLTAPQFSIPGALYDFDAYQPDLKVSLIDPNPQQTAQLYFSLANGPWTQWNGAPISIARALTTELRAYSMPLNADRFEQSAVSEAVYETIYFGGSSAGVFSNPKGDSALATNLSGGKTGTFFTWGSQATGFKYPNSLQVTARNFAVVAPNQLFELANLTYYNGSTYAGTNATEVQLNVTLNLTTPGLVETLPFIFKLLSTPNKGVSADADADYVYIPSVSTKFNTIIKGQTFYLVLSFGSNSTNGFTTIDKFHVHENKTMTGSIYGRFTTTPPLP